MEIEPQNPFMRPLNEFAGWLRVFQFICYLNMVIGVVQAFMLVGDLFSQPDKIVTLLIFLENGITIYILFTILKMIYLRDPAIPQKITDLLFYLFVIAIIFLIINIAITTGFNKENWTDNNLITMMAAFNKLVWCMVWRTYYMRSKRVREYYKALDHSQEQSQLT